MSTPSSLYADKIFSEHPSALWALDEQVDYISLITEQKRNIGDEWVVENGISSSGTLVLDEPFQDSITNLIQGNVPIGTTNEIILTSSNIDNFLTINQNFDTFSIGMYFFSNSPYFESISIGYEYTDPDTLVDSTSSYTFTNLDFQKWNFISQTFNLLDKDANFRIVIKILTNDGGSSINDYEFYINGISVGQWCEEFQTESLGITPITVPSNIYLVGEESGVPAYTYGTYGDTGYYLIYQNALKCRKGAMPIVFGSNSAIEIFENEERTDNRLWSDIDNEIWQYWKDFGDWDLIKFTNNPIYIPRPSLLFPGKGFLNENGRYNEYTVEFWMKVNSNTEVPVKIFGPVASSAGLYIEGGFLTLSIGGMSSSHFVGEWLRPMMVHIRIIKNNISVLLNGEEVISLIIDTQSISLPSKVSSEGKDQDWIGFYSYVDSGSMKVDAVALYPYQVPTTVAKRRWVYGQGVVSSEKIDLQYGGTPALIDYSFADYTSNYSYPNFAKWNQGSFDNLLTTSRSLSLPKYELPEIYLGSKTIKQLYDDNFTLQVGPYKFFSFRPNETWDDLTTYISFPKFNVLNNKVNAFYGVFEYQDNLSQQILFKIYDSANGNYFTISKNNNNIEYYLDYNGSTELIFTEQISSYVDNFVAGINISDFSNTYGGNVSTFFGNQNSLKMYVAGDPSGNYSFLGKIYSISFCSDTNFENIKSNFGVNGVATFDTYLNVIDFIASYTLWPIEAYSSFSLNIGSSGTWEDYMPLSYFGQYVKNESGDEYYNLDFIQMNVGYHSICKNMLTDNQHYDTTDNELRSYVSFQYIAEGANAPKSYFTTIEKPNKNLVLDLSNYPNWKTTKFEVIDNTIIYPPQSVDFNSLAIVYNLEFNVTSSITKSLSLSSLEFSSQCFNSNSFNPIGTRYGVEIYPYTKSGFYYNYKAKNPFSIYKASNPYMYLTKNSGIRIVGDISNTINRGISIPVNKSKANSYKISAFQAFLKYDQQSFPSELEKLFEIEYKDDTIQFYILSNGPSGNRGKIVAKSMNTGRPYTNIKYYINGVIASSPVLTLDSWIVLGISFPSAISFDSYMGSINVNGKAIFNNITPYQKNSLQQAQSQLTRPWLYVKENDLIEFDWQYWVNSFTWQTTLVISSSDLYGIDPKTIYSNYFGSNKIVIDDNAGINIGSDKMKIYENVSWSISSVTPV
jgi:hypothetical protein